MTNPTHEGAGLIARGLRVRHRRGPEVLRGVDVEAPRGAVTALIGPNGAGKSTALKAIVGLLPHQGEVSLDGVSLATLQPRDRARRIAYVPQRTQLSAPLPVRSVVSLGRFAWRPPLAPPTREDRDAVELAMAEAGATELAERAFTALSGGEQQRVLLARALATGARALLLDEPTASLDVRQAIDLHETLRRLAGRGCAIVVVLHDLSEVRRTADRVVMLDNGVVRAAGAVAEVITPAPVRSVYQVDLIEGGGLGYRRPGRSPQPDPPPQ